MAIKKIPLLGLGTWLLYGKQCEKAVKWALEIGYRHIDTAHVYENHKAIAKAKQGFNRDKLFITSKIALEQVKDSNIEKSVEKACDKALKDLKTSYLNLYLIHWPNRDRPLAEIFAAMQHLVQKGKVLAVGTSNFTINHLQDLIHQGLSISANQVEFHPHLYQKQLLEFCASHKIELIAFRPFGKGDLLQNEPLFSTLGAKYGKTGAQIVLRWLVQKNIPTIPKASSEKHLSENFDVFNFSLSQEDEQALDTLHQDKRYCQAEWSDFDY